MANQPVSCASAHPPLQSIGSVHRPWAMCLDLTVLEIGTEVVRKEEEDISKNNNYFLLCFT